MKLEKTTYLTIISIFLFILLAIPSVVFKQVLGKYFSFVYTWAEKPTLFLKQKIVSRVHVKYDAKRADLKLPDLKFVKFSVEINSAKNVYIIGDFNEWKKNRELKKVFSKKWEIEIPLVKGKYRYLFVVDGKEILDPLNPNVDYFKGKKVSVIEVK